MNIKSRILVLVACALTLAIPTSAFAGKGARKARKGEQAGKSARPGMLLKKYDTDKNGTIDGTEVEALRKAFDNDPLKKIDANNDGKLDDTEIAAIKARHGRGETGKGGKRRKKNV